MHLFGLHSCHIPNQGVLAKTHEQKTELTRSRNPKGQETRKQNKSETIQEFHVKMNARCYGLNCAPPRPKSQSLSPKKVTLLGTRVVADVISGEEVVLEEVTP